MRDRVPLHVSDNYPSHYYKRLGLHNLHHPTTATTHNPLPPTACPCAGWQDCTDGRCVRKPECHFYKDPNDMGDGGGTHAQWHTEDNWRNYCDQLGGESEKRNQCNNVESYADKVERCYKIGLLFCSNQWISDKSNAYCKVEEQPTTTPATETTTSGTTTSNTTRPPPQHTIVCRPPCARAPGGRTARMAGASADQSATCSQIKATWGNPAAPTRSGTRKTTGKPTVASWAV